VVEGERPVSLNDVPVGVPTWAKFVQPAPAQRSTRYSDTPTLSVEAVQLRLIWVAPAAVAVSPVGAVGGVVSGAAGVVAVAIAEYGLRLTAASAARTWYR